MKDESRTTIVRSGGVVAMMCLAVTVAASAMFATPCLGLPQSVPSKIADLKTGVSQAELMKRLSGEDDITTEPSKEKRGPVVTWKLANSPYYEKVSFRFTEKDRLFLIRFALKSSAREQFAALKEDFFGKYDFSPEKPFHLRRQDDDILLYGPNSGATLFFLEFTNTKTGKKWYEVFNRVVSGEDRPVAPPQKEGEKPSAGQPSPAGAPKPGAEVSPGKSGGAGTASSGKSVQPPKESPLPGAKEPQDDKGPEGKKDANAIPSTAPAQKASPPSPQPKEGDKAPK